MHDFSTPIPKVREKPQFLLKSDSNPFHAQKKKKESTFKNTIDFHKPQNIEPPTARP